MVSVLSGFCRRVCTRPAAPPISLFSTRKIWSPGRSPVRASVTSRTSTPAPAPVDLAVKPSGWNDWTLRTTLQPLSATAASASSSETTSRILRAFIGDQYPGLSPQKHTLCHGNAFLNPSQTLILPQFAGDASRKADAIQNSGFKDLGRGRFFREIRKWPLTPLAPSPIPSPPPGEGETTRALRGSAEETRLKQRPPSPGGREGMGEGPGVRGLELDRDAAHQPAAQLVVVRGGAGGVGEGAAAQLHVELDRPVRREVHQEAQVLGELEAQALDFDLGGGALVVARLQLLGEVVESHEDSRLRAEELGVERGHQILDLILIGAPVGRDEGAAAARGETGLEAGEHVRGELLGELEAHLGEVVPAHQV